MDVVKLGLEFFILLGGGRVKDRVRDRGSEGVLVLVY